MKKLTREQVLKLLGDPKKVAKELADFTERMKRENYDPPSPPHTFLQTIR